jgi:hypothetical protein
MRAYVFWHYPQPRYTKEEYEAAQTAFHQTLASHPIPGLLRSYCFEVNAIPWLEQRAGYEDWYLVNDTAALESLNTGAVSDLLAGPHNRAAALAAGGIAGLYKPLGSPDTIAGGTVLWFRKPPGMRYDTLFERLEPVRDKLWQRMLTLGPTPEFCLLQSGPAYLPPDWETKMLVRRPVFGA